MGHWTDRYVGLPYVEGECDCASLTERVQREQFGREIALPSARADNHRGWSEQIRQHRDDYVLPTRAPVEGDLVLMIGRGYLNHIGTLVLVEGVHYVLHAMYAARQVCMHRVARLADVACGWRGITSGERRPGALTPSADAIG